MDDKPEPKTVEIPTKHLAVGSVLVSAIMVLNPVKEMFFTRTEAEAQGQKIERVEASIFEVKEEVNRNADRIIDQIRESEARSMRNADKMEDRINRLEAFRLKALKTGG